jgi:hypothetical protein
MFQFGVGGCWGVPSGGNLATPSFPQQFGTLQDTSVDMDSKLVELRGQNRFPDDAAPGDMTVKGKAAFAKIEVDIYNSLFFGDTIATGVKVIARNEPHTTTANAATVTYGATFNEDLGVLYAANGKPLQEVTAGNEALGKYSYNANNGLYTFAANDNNTAMLFSYSYSDANNGKTLTVTNQLLGYGPVFELWLSAPYQGHNGLHLFACRSSKMGFPMKRDGYVIVDAEFTAFANAAGSVLEFFQSSI